MKRILLLLILFAGVTSSCKKILDTKPDGNLTPENSYGSPAQISAALSGIYTNLKYVISYSQYYTTYLTAPTDETYFYNSTGFVSFANTANDNTTGNPTNIWRGCYQSINYANTLIDNIDESSAGKVDANVVRRAKGEAIFMRGFYYFLLAQWYGDVPLQIHATTDPTQSQIARTPVKEVYDQIITDMTLADSLLYDQTFTSLGYSDRITRTGVEAMLARVCLFAAGEPVNDKKRYADALEWAKKVVASGQHSLVSSYPQVFIDEARNIYNSENIFEIGFIVNPVGTQSAGGGIGVYNGVSMGNSNGTNSSGGSLYDSGYVYGYLKLHPRLYFKYEPGDYRRNWNISNYSNTTASAAYNTPDGRISAYSPSGVATKSPLNNNSLWARQPAKWRREYEAAVSRSTQTGSSTNFPVIRYADVLLMLAEAENEVNGPTQVAFDALNQVRRRSMSTTRVVDSIGFTVGSGYTSAPDSVTWTTGGGSGFGFNVVYSASAKTVQVLLTNQGSGFTSAPTITVGRQWRAGTAYTVGTQVAASNGRLYTVTTSGTSTSTAPTNTSGVSSASSTGAVFTYAGVAATATVYLSPVPVVDYTAAVLGTKGIDLRQAIRDERSRELCFEALRLQDLKRWGILIPTIQSLALDIAGNNPLYPKIPSAASELGVGNDASALAPVQNISQKDMFLPIPIWDLNLNKKLTQNPGY
jgi:starch-binding outer membrane protein, SusD/RagB family